MLLKIGENLKAKAKLECYENLSEKNVSLHLCFLFFNLFIYLFIHSVIHLFVYLFIYLVIYLYIYLFIEKVQSP